MECWAQGKRRCANLRKCGFESGCLDDQWGRDMITYESSSTREYLLLSWDKKDLEDQASKGGYGVRSSNLIKTQ